MKAFFTTLAVCVSVTLFAGLFLALDVYGRNDLVLPRTALGDMALGGMTREEVRNAIRERLTRFVEDEVQLVAQGEIQEVSLRDLGVVMNEAIVLAAIPFAGELSNAEIILWSFAGQRIMPEPMVARTELLRIVDETFPNIAKTKNAHFVKEGKALVIKEAESGETLEVEKLFEALKKNIAFLEHAPLIAEFRTAAPSITASDLEARKDEIAAAFPQTLKLVHENKTWTLDFQKNPQWIIFDRKPYELAPGVLPFSLQFDPVEFSTFINDGVSSSLEQAPENVRIFRDEKGGVVFDGHANDGRAIERERLLTLINLAIADGKEEVEVPLAVVPPKIEVADDLKALGIQDLLAVGYTRYEGSPVNRKHNIAVGTSKFNGVLIAPGETFSFNKVLGLVDGSTGYRKELVIKPEGTIPEYGGGICQVSTTMFRAALNGGLPIVDRAPHSYIVRYYAQVGGDGLDATVYPPTRDFKFQNDTPGHILIQSYVEGVSAYFKFYGTSDGRSVALEGPYISNRRSPPAEAVFIADPNLNPGEKKQVEKPHAGLDVLWYRHITKNGVTTKEELFSRYRAIPAKFLVGGQVTAAGENEGLTEPVNPFE